MIMATGQNVPLSAVEVHKPDPKPAPTLPLLSEEQIVRVMLNRNKPVTLTLAKVSVLFIVLIVPFYLKS